jgi:hypothetical protein
MVTQVDEARAEIAALLAEFAPILEGLRDYGRLNLKPETQTVVQQAIAAYENRVAKLVDLETAAAALVADGHPEIPIKEVSELVYADIADQERTIQAAKSRFRPPEPASAFQFATGTTELK